MCILWLLNSRFLDIILFVTCLHFYKYIFLNRLKIIPFNLDWFTDYQLLKKLFNTVYGTLLYNVLVNHTTDLTNKLGHISYMVLKEHAHLY